MTTSTISARSKFATGINVFALPFERQRELLETLHAINEEIRRRKLPMNVSSSFHRAIGSPVVINYNQYVDRKDLRILRSIPETAPLLKRTHELSDRHEMRWYEVADVVTSDSTGGEIEISNDANAVAAIGIFTVKPGKQDELLAVLKDYGEMLKAAKTRGFLGIATHRGYEPGHVASYEQWRTADAYATAIRLGFAADADERIRRLTDEFDRHLYDVVEVARFDLQRDTADS